MVREEEGASLTAEGRRKLGVVELNAQKMDLLVNDLLTLARLSQAPLSREDTDIAGLAREIADEQCQHFHGARVTVGPLPRASVDPALMRQALVNLIDNALKYSSRSEAPRVEIGWRADGAAYFVHDNGVGFDMKYYDRLFRTFERLHSEREFPGTGIGLVIVKRVVERHGGRVWAESEPRKGATFLFTLGA
jgi:light-regulated signal transduction histidine kinase (bacteriophytochrome)